MKPIPPPPRYQGSKAHRKKDLFPKSNYIESKCSPIQSWMPFVQYDDFDMGTIENEVSIAPSYVYDESEEDGGIETQLTYDLNTCEELPENDQGNASYSSLENLQPIPVPYHQSENIPPYGPNTLDLEMTQVERVDNFENRPLASLQSISNQKIVQRKGLGKRSSKYPSKTVTEGTCGGIVAADSSKGRSSRGFSILSKKRNKQKLVNKDKV